jgi:hypothetical protein
MNDLQEQPASPDADNKCNEFECLDCERDTLDLDEYYVVHNTVWKSATSKKERRGMLCIGCLEHRLGRMLDSRDFTFCLSNFKACMEGSDQLQDRLASEHVLAEIARRLLGNN